jgi:hypothetical protein
MEPRLSYISPSLNEEALQHAIAYKLMFILGKDPSLANKHEWLNATLFAVRDRLVDAGCGRIGRGSRSRPGRFIICRWSFSSAVPL